MNNAASTDVVHVFPALDRTLHGTLLDSLRTLINHRDLTRQPCAGVGARPEVRGSRTPLREPLEVPAAERIAQLLPNRGARVASMDEGALGHPFEVGMQVRRPGRSIRARVTGNRQPHY